MPLQVEDVNGARTSRKAAVMGKRHAAFLNVLVQDISPIKTLIASFVISMRNGPPIGRHVEDLYADIERS